MANIKLSTIEDRLASMKRADNHWAETYARDVSHLLKLLTDQRAELHRQVREMRDALKHMLHIFDRELPPRSIGRNVCDEARAALSAIDRVFEDGKRKSGEG